MEDKAEWFCPRCKEDGLPPWLHLCTDDYDNELVSSQMRFALVEGIGFTGFRYGAITDPSQIIGGKPGDAARAIRQRERLALYQSLGINVPPIDD